MKVYITTLEIPYEGTTLLNVFGSFELAEMSLLADGLVKTRTGDSFTEYQYPNSNYEEYYVTEYEVQE